MATRRLLAAGTVLALALSGCTGFLRSISSDNAVDYEQTADHYWFSSRDFTITLPGQWESVDDQIVDLTGAYEYDTNKQNAEHLTVRMRAEVGRQDDGDCIKNLYGQLLDQGWGARGRSFEVEIAGQQGSRLDTQREGVQLYAYCLPSDQSAMVILMLASPEALEQTPEQADALLSEGIVWKR